MQSLQEAAADKAQAGQWAALGGNAFAREARLAEKGKEAIVLAFPAPRSREVTTASRAPVSDNPMAGGNI